MRRNTEPGTLLGNGTKQLNYLEKVIVPALWQHQYSWPFYKPVDAEALGLPVSISLCTQCVLCSSYYSYALNMNE